MGAIVGEDPKPPIGQQPIMEGLWPCQSMGARPPTILPDRYITTTITSLAHLQQNNYQTSPTRIWFNLGVRILVQHYFKH